MRKLLILLLLPSILFAQTVTPWIQLRPGGYVKMNSGTTANGIEFNYLSNSTATYYFKMSRNNITRSFLDTSGIMRLKYLKFDTTNFSPTYIKGTLYCDFDNYTLSYQTGLGNSTQQIGQELYTKVQNNSGGTISNGNAVYIYDAGGQVPRIRKAKADKASTAYNSIGCVTSDVTHGNKTFTTTYGLVRGLNTNGLIEGKKIYESQTTEGAWTQTKPSSGHIIRIGYVNYANSANGEILLAPHEETNQYTATLSEDATNGVVIDTINGVRLIGTTTCFDEIQFDLNSLKSLGAVSKPDYDLTNLCYLFPQNDTTEVMGTSEEMPHWWKEGSNGYFMVHFDQTQNLIPVFYVQYKIYSVGVAEPSTWTTSISNSLSATYHSGTIGQIAKFPITTTFSGNTLGATLKVRLYRKDNVYTGDCRVTRFGLHIERDAFGSATEYTK